MTRAVILSAAILFWCWALAQGCSPEADSLPINPTVEKSESAEIRYSAEFYYHLLLFIKENNLLALGPCPMCRCFTDGVCVDLCDPGYWP